ncbi:TetR family transcriptional regulator [Mycolicibacterium sp. S2-37]|uniref:TetR/AcrR family transcriptional regulator n=1 Tax=Mycolicibacterium sp. S2-37 TaxID=2810297 RepID=UPI001A94DC52|nr:TetR family transcriptional regulator [Mycolicibacterium sp. S2-37]MBO0678777.1 TetR family transcriptional regulator [Mycolicibacterium sp. S2-37]
MPADHQQSDHDEGDAPLPLRERQRIALRTEIQQAALRLFAAHGYDNVTTEAIAEQVGISPSTFFRHVPSKEYLLLGAAHRGRAKIVANFHARPATEAITESIAAAILARTAQFVDDDETLELWRRAMASAPAELRRASVLNREDCDELISAVARRLDNADAGADIRAGVLVRAAVAAVEYAYEWWLTYDQSESLHALTDRALELVIHGLAAPVSPARRRTSTM